MKTTRSASFRSALGSAALPLIGFVGLTLSAAPALAQGKLDARYEVTLAGLTIGKGAWVIEIADDQYSASANGGTTGFLRAFAGGNGTGDAQGRITNGQFVPINYEATTTSSKKSEAIRMTMAAGNVKDFTIEPAPPPPPENAVPLTDAHKRGVLDPMTATLLRVGGTGDPVSPEACHGGPAIFDGRIRYDLRLEYKRMDSVKAERGYAGPVVVCAVYFTPVAGHVADRPAIKYLTAQKNMEIWYAPIPGTRVLVPFRLSIPTPLGTGVLEATQFVTSVLPPRTAARTQ